MKAHDLQILERDLKRLQDASALLMKAIGVISKIKDRQQISNLTEIIEEAVSEIDNQTMSTEEEISHLCAQTETVGG